MRLVCDVGEAPTDWSSLLRSADRQCSLHQTEFRARYLAESAGVTPYYLRVMDGDVPVASLLCFERRPFYRTTPKSMQKISSLITGSSKGVIEWIEGPIFYREDKVIRVLELFLSWMKEQFNSKGLNRIHCSGLPLFSEYVDSDSVDKVFEKFGFSRSIWATYLVDLSVGEEVLWRKIKSSARKSIGRCIKESVTVRRLASFEEFRHSFYTSYCQAEAEGGRTAGPLERYEILFKEDVEGVYSFWLAETEDGKPLATLGTFKIGSVATEIASSTLNLARVMKLGAQDFLHWKIFISLMQEGCTTFNLAGVSPNPQNPKEAGIRRFKEKWSGEYIEYARYDLNSLHSRMVQSIAQKVSNSNALRHVCQRMGLSA